MEASVALVRDAAARGAQIICLKELFNAPYFCKVQTAARFDLAEPIPGPTTDRMQAVAKELGVVIMVPTLRATRLARSFMSQLRGDHRCRRLRCSACIRKMHIPDDPLFFEKYYFAPGDTGDDTPCCSEWRRSPRRRAAFAVWKTRLCLHRRVDDPAGTNGIPGGRAVSPHYSAPTFCFIQPRSVGIPAKNRSSERHRSKRGARCSGRMRLRTVSSSPRRIASVTKVNRAPTDWNSLAAPSSRIRLDVSSHRREPIRKRSLQSPDLEADRGHATQSGRSCAIDASRRIRPDSVAMASSGARDRVRCMTCASRPKVRNARLRLGSRGRIMSRIGRASSRRFRGSTPKLFGRCICMSASRFFAMMKV